MSTPFNPFQSGASVPSPAVAPSSAHRGVDAAAVRLAPLHVAQPPTPLLFVAGVIALGGLVAAVVGWQNWVALFGWALAGPVAIGVMGAFVGIDTRRRAEPIYVRPGWIGGAYATVALISGIGIIVGAIGFALWMGRQ